MESVKTYSLIGKAETIFARLKDLEYYGKLHPLIKRVDLLDTEEDGQLYQITERPFKYIPFNIRYKAMVKTSKSEIDFEISGIPLTQVFVHYKIDQAAENRSKIQFQLKIISKMLGQALLLQKMIAAQDKLMLSLQKELE